MKFKKIAAMISAAALALALTGCGKEANDPFANNPQSGQSSGANLNPFESKPAVCSSCGTALITDAQFCYKCGASVAASNVPPNAASAQLPDIPVNDASAFEYKFDSELGGMVITDYKLQSPKVHIPDMLENEKVVRVDFRLVTKAITHIIMPDSVKVFDFSDSDMIRKSLQFVNIPASVTKIAAGSFLHCTRLTSVTIPNSVTEIGYSAFYGCTSLTSITIPNSVTNIGTNAFSDCRSLTSITIPNSVTNIGSGAFDGCTSLTSMTYKGKTYNNQYDLYKAINGN